LTGILKNSVASSARFDSRMKSFLKGRALVKAAFLNPVQRYLRLVMVVVAQR